MNWEAIGAVGEVGGAIAVVATLVYVALQVRRGRQSRFENTSATVVVPAAQPSS